MNLHSIGGELGIYAGTFVIGFLAGLIPTAAGVEAWLIAVTLAMTSPAPLALVVVLASLGQMVAKVLLYYAANGAIRIPKSEGRIARSIEKARGKIEKWKSHPKWVLWGSATLGFPPFYVISLLAGALEIRLRTFCLIGLAGRLARFSTVVVLCWYGVSR